MAPNYMLSDKIAKLKKSKNAIVLAHYYQPLEIQLAADIVGDSLELARKSQQLDAEILVFCGVRFMAESASLLCPDKKVLLPALDAGCEMADMVTPEIVRELKGMHPDSAVVCYINSTAETKAECDICCTSSNAVRVVNSLNTDSVIFIPDKNLGGFIARQTPEKTFHFLENGCCPIHENLSLEKVLNLKKQHCDALVLAHPECSYSVCNVSDFVGSTSQIIDYCQSNDSKEFIICTEVGVIERMRYFMPNKSFYVPDSKQLYCKGMKKITLEMLADTLENCKNEITVSDKLRAAALRPIERMLKL